MENKKIGKRTLYIILSLLFGVVLIGGGTLAYFAWSSTGENKDASVSVTSVNGLGQCNKISDNEKILFPVLNKDNGRVITVNAKQTLSEYAYIVWSLSIDSINTNETLTNGLKHQSFKYELVNTTTGVSYGSGNFEGKNANDTIVFQSNEEKLAYNTNYTFALYLWIDGTIGRNPDDMLNQTYQFNLVCDITGSPVGTAATYISNLYTKATKTTHTDSKYNITYNYAEDVNLMNDRLASMSVNADDGNIRYYGADPNNYVYFNGELWRIIGVFDGKLKIIRNESIGNYSWDTSSMDVNSGYGINQWGPSIHADDNSTYDGADLMKLLNPGYETNADKTCKTTYNGSNCNNNADEDYENITVNNSLYWNAQSGKCYNGINNKVGNCDFSTNGLKSGVAKNMIAEVVWNLGTHSVSTDPYNGQMTASKLYEWEYSNNSGIQCTENSAFCSTDVVGTTTWSGKVGLMSPADYAYATGGGSESLNTCLSNNLGYVTSGSSIKNWNYDYPNCFNDDWLTKTTSRQWTILSRATTGATNVYYATANNTGYIHINNAITAYAVRPVLFLKTNVLIDTVGRDGTASKPYVVSMNS